MSLKYATSLGLLHITAKPLFSNQELYRSVQLSVGDLISGYVWSTITHQSVPSHHPGPDPRIMVNIFMKRGGAMVSSNPIGRRLQNYLAYKKTHSPRTLQ